MLIVVSADWCASANNGLTLQLVCTSASMILTSVLATKLGYTCGRTGVNLVWIWMAGLEGADKSTILFKEKLGEMVTTIATIVSNAETVEYKDFGFTLWVCWLEQVRPLWHHSQQDTNVATPVVDSNDRDMFEEVRAELNKSDERGRNARKGFVAVTVLQGSFTGTAFTMKVGEPSDFELSQHASLISWQRKSIAMWQLKATRQSSQSSRKSAASMARHSLLCS